MPVEYFEKKRPLDADLGDFVITRVGFNRIQKKLVSFCVIQLHFAGENNYEVIRFDTAHGHCHVHRFYQRLDDKGKELKGKSITQRTFDECRNDVKANWGKYKKLYVEKWLK